MNTTNELTANETTLLISCGLEAYAKRTVIERDGNTYEARVTRAGKYSTGSILVVMTTPDAKIVGTFDINTRKLKGSDKKAI